MQFLNYASIGQYKMPNESEIRLQNEIIVCKQITCDLIRRF